MKYSIRKILAVVAVEVVTGIGSWFLSKYLDSLSKSSNLLIMLHYLLLTVFFAGLIYLLFLMFEGYINYVIAQRFKREYQNLNRTQNDIELLVKYINYRFEKYTTVTIGGGSPRYISEIHSNFNQEEVNRLVELRAIFEQKEYKA